MLTTVKLEDYFDFLAEDDIRLKGHRIGIENVLFGFLYKLRGGFKFNSGKNL